MSTLFLWCLCQLIECNVVYPRNHKDKKKKKTYLSSHSYDYVSLPDYKNAEYRTGNILISQGNASTHTNRLKDKSDGSQMPTKQV